MLEVTTASTSEGLERSPVIIWDATSGTRGEQLPLLQRMWTVKDMLTGPGHHVELGGGQYQFRFFDGSEVDIALFREGFSHLSPEVIYQRFRRGGVSADLALEFIKENIATILVLHEGIIIGWAELARFHDHESKLVDPSKVVPALVIRSDYQGRKIGLYLENLLLSFAQTLEGVEFYVVIVNGRVTTDETDARVAYHMARKLNDRMGGGKPERLGGGELMYTIPLYAQREP